MPRDGSGNYTLPAGNPVSPGATIESNWANSTMDDLAVSMTDSLSRTGSGSMLVPFQNIDGTESLPGITWAQEPSSGIYRATTGDMRASILGADQARFTTASQLEVFRSAGFRRVPDVFTDTTVAGVWTFSATPVFSAGATFSGQILAINGTTLLPSYAFTTDPSMGMYFAGADLLGWTTAGVTRMSLTNGVFATAAGTVIRSGEPGSAGTPAFSFVGQPDTGMYRPGTSIGFAVSGADVLFILPNQMRSDVTGSAALPAWSFSADIGMGMYRGGAGVLAFATEGVQRFNLVSSGANFLVPRALMENGNATAPAWSFTSQPNMGMYRDTTDRLSFATAGALKGFFDAQGFTSQAKVTAQVGTEAAPSFTFAGFPDVGLYGAVNAVNVAAGGALVWSMSSNGMFAGTSFAIHADGALTTPAKPGFAFGNDADTGMFRSAANTLAFSAGAETRMTLNTLSQMNLLQAGVTGGTTIQFQNSAGLTAWNIQYEGTGGFQPLQFSFSRFNSTTGIFIDIPLYIASNGRVHSLLPILTP